MRARRRVDHARPRASDSIVAARLDPVAFTPRRPRPSHSLDAPVSRSLPGAVDSARHPACARTARFGLLFAVPSGPVSLCSNCLRLSHRTPARRSLRAPLAPDGRRRGRSWRGRSRARCVHQGRSACAWRVGQEGRGAAARSIVRAHSRSKGGRVDGRSNVGSKYQVMDVIGEGAVRDREPDGG